MCIYGYVYLYLHMFVCLWVCIWIYVFFFDLSILMFFCFFSHLPFSHIIVLTWGTTMKIRAFLPVLRYPSHCWCYSYMSAVSLLNSVGSVGQTLAWVAWLVWVCKILAWVKKMAWVAWVEILAWWCGSIKFWHGSKKWRVWRESISLAWVKILA